MKTRILALSLFCFVLSLSLPAQPKSGTVMLTPKGYLSYTTSDFDELTVFEINPKAGFSLLNNFVFGSELFWRRQNSTRTTNGFIENIYGVSPFIKYYFFEERRGPFIEFGASYLWLKNNTFKEKFNYSEYNIRPGLALFLSPNVSVETFLTIPFRKKGRKEDLINPDYQLDDIALHFEMNYFLTGGKNRTSEDIFPTYIQKGSRSIGLSGHWNFAPFFMLNRFSIRSFTEEKHQLNHQIQVLLSPKAKNSVFIHAWEYKPEYQPFIQIHERTFFIPSVGLTFGPIFDSRDVKLNFLGNLYTRPTLIHFLRRAILSTGFEFRTPYMFSVGKEIEFSDDWFGQFVFSFEFFLQQNLSLKSTLYSNAFGFRMEGISLIENSLPPIYFEVGFSYFLSPKEKYSLVN